MKLAVDLHHLGLEHAGTKRVTMSLLSQFRKTQGIKLIELRPGYSLEVGSGTLGKLLKHLLRFFWVHIDMPLRCLRIKPDFLFSPEFNCPMFAPCPRAVIAHDAHVRAQRQYTSSIWFYLYYIPFIEWAIRRADLVFSVSCFAKNQIVELMKLEEAKVHVAYNGVDNIFFKGPDHFEAMLPNGLVYNEYILFVGTFEARKNIERLIRAFSLLKEKHHANLKQLKLAIVGQSSAARHSDRSKEIIALIVGLGLEKEIVLSGYVGDAQLPEIYRNARLLAFPSLHEGFGLPIVEAFASGVPVLTSNLCSLPEIAGSAALLVDPYKVDDILEKLEVLCFDDELRQRLIGAGAERAKVFTWEKCSNKILSEINAVLNRKDAATHP